MAHTLSLDQIIRLAIKKDGAGKIGINALAASGGLSSVDLSAKSKEQILRALFSDNGDGTWGINLFGAGGGGGASEMTAATTSAAGVGGTTPNAPIDSQNKFLKGSATFGTAIPLWSSSVVYEVDDIVRGADDKIYRVTTAHTGGSFTSGNFTELSAGGGSSLTVTTVGTAIFQYEILTGTPVIGYTKTGGAGNGVMTCTGGTIKLRRFTDDILTADLAGGLTGSIRFDLVGTGTVYKLARPCPTKYLLITTDALADASTNASTANQVDIDNTPPVKYGNIVLTGHGAMSIRLDNVANECGINFQW